MKKRKSEDEMIIVEIPLETIDENIEPSKDESIDVDNYFGKCPECGSNDGYLNVERDHWFVCDQHKIKWYVGSNLFSGWRDESPEDWERNRKLLATYREI